MPKPYLLRHVKKVLKAKGFFFVSQKGSHEKYKRRGDPGRMVIIPVHGKRNSLRHIPINSETGKSV
ncbi:type II toxin-antitoxin system HicA family toxin [Patescibacteria group bacterium]|nr:type II toxin-antitoxin system HicA family toxin [Patescibacteria group bacterium]